MSDKGVPDLCKAEQSTFYISQALVLLARLVFQVVAAFKQVLHDAK